MLSVLDRAVSPAPSTYSVLLGYRVPTDTMTERGVCHVISQGVQGSVCVQCICLHVVSDVDLQAGIVLKLREE